MKPAPDDPLLRALLDEATPPDYRAATLATALRGARRRRTSLRARSAARTLALPLLALALLALALRQPTRSIVSESSPIAASGACAVVRSQAATAMVVRTESLSANLHITSVALETTALVRTDARLGPTLIDDAELLALAPPASALIRLGPGRQQLWLPTDSRSTP